MLIRPEQIFVGHGCVLGQGIARGPGQALVARLSRAGGVAGRSLLVVGGGPIGLLIYMMKYRQRVVDDIVVNMVDVGEETGELDTMLYKVADTYDEEVKVMTDGLMALMEPLIIVFLGVAVGFIVISLFMPLVSLIQNLT